jgi:hypothetical protein
MKSHFIIFNLFTVFLFGIKASYSSDDIELGYTPVPFDSIIFEDYRAISYNYVDSLGEQFDRETGIRIFKKNKRLISINENINELTNLCSLLPYIHDDCYFHDINKDGLKELVITVGWMGGSCCEGGLKLYSINDTANLLIEMTPTTVGFRIKDIENDSIPEFITWDGTFTFFMYYPYRAFNQQLIWKWDGIKYRIANSHFADYLLNQLGSNKMPPLEYITEVDSTKIDSIQTIGLPSFYFLDMVFGYYFAGKPQTGDSLFDVYWPPNLPGKDNYWQEIHNRIDADTLWPQILDSNW